MIETVIAFGFALGLILLAQFGESRPWARWATMLILLASGLLVFLFGIALLIDPAFFQRADRPFDAVRLGWTMILVGLFVLVPVIAGMLLSRGGNDPTLRGVPWTRPVHLTAWTLLVLFIGSNFGVAAMDALSEIDIGNPLMLLIPQNLAFALAAVLGVGWGVRRSWPQVSERLGFTPPSARDFLLGLAMALIMLFTTMLVGGLVTLVFGSESGLSSGFNEQIIRQLPGVGGVVLMGLATGIGEEMLYRGALQPVAGVWLTSFLFAISHIQYLSPAILVIFVLGLLLGYTRNKWGLNTAIWSHALYNTLVGLLALLAMNLPQFSSGAGF